MVQYIQLTPEVKTPKGNFAHLYNHTQNEELFLKCLNAEQQSKNNFNMLRGSLRIALELTAYDLETRRRIGREDRKRPWDVVWKEVLADGENSFRSNNKNNSPKKILNREIQSGNIQSEVFLRAYRRFFQRHVDLDPELYQEYQKKERKWSISNFIYDLYAFASEGLHAGDTVSDMEIGPELLRLFHDLLNLLYGLEHAYQPELCPIDEYFPLQRAAYRNLGLNIRDVPDIYVTEQENGEIEYFLLKRVANDSALTERREIAALDKLWKRTMDSPNNVPYMRGVIGKGPYLHQVFAFPSRPMALTEKRMETFSRAQKDAICLGMLKAVASLHSMKPPLPHRGLNPTSFYLCGIGKELRPLLVNFETVKDLSGTASYTVGAYVRGLDQDKNRRDFLAPEILGDPDDSGDLRKADIYSMGRLFAYVYTGRTMPGGSEADLSPDKWDLIRRMTALEPAERPSITEVLQYFSTSSVTEPSYAVCSIRGRRQNYEDAFYCSESETLEWEDQLIERKAALPLVLGVFDGMGGEDAGAEMSALAARSCRKLCKNLSIYEYDDYDPQLRYLVQQMEQEALDYQQSAGLERSGTTMVMALVTGRQLHYVNVGDSRIYRIHAHRIEQLSQDHCSASVGRRKGPLYQYIGMPQDEYEIDPWIGQSECDPKDYILLCSDGLSDVLPEEEILQILYTPGSLEQKVWALVEQADENGSTDNITVILYTWGEKNAAQ